ncbi:MAG: L-glutamate gamma-semialdehyde dehydrogenase [Desulfomonile tiedjei]|nr:L-glutamate gamma-semialdehyde dehydrogenase [Desulfomonile tiedjei]
MSSYPDLEERIRRTGREIFSLVGEEVPSLFDRQRWTGKMMEWAMKDEQVKVQLFRFVDVLPCLRTDDLVMRVLNEYFRDLRSTPVLRGIGLLSRTGLIPRIAGKLIRKNVTAMARQFIAGSDPEDALPALEGLREEGLAISVDLLGEEVLSDAEAAAYTERYLDLLRLLVPRARSWQDASILDRDRHGSLPRVDVSLKVSSFNPRLDPANWEGSVDATRAGVRPVLHAVQDLGASVTFDMESYYFKDLTLAIFLAVLEEFADFPFGGIALQAYLTDTKDDLLHLIAWAKKHRRRIGVRLTKGAYWDYETVIARQLGWPIPVLVDKARTDLQFEELAAILLENTEYVRPAIATHNVRSISHAIAVADSLKLPKEAIEFQVIYGMAEPIRTALRKMGFRVRVYTPIGELIPGMAYLIRRLLENTSNESFLRKSFSEGTPPDELTRRPVPPAAAEPEESQGNSFANEPLTDFSKEQNRKSMLDALKRVGKQFDATYPLVIGRDEVRTDKEIRSRNPARPGEIVGRVSAAAVKHAERAVAEANRVWLEWRKTAPAERAEYLFRAAEHMRTGRFDLVALEVFEVGKTWNEADADVAEAIDFLEYYGREMIGIGAPRLLGAYPGEENAYLYEPRGVGVVVSPWNFPLAIPTGMVSAALVTGNCVIFKPSSLSPVLGWKLFEAFRRAGLPHGVLQFLSGSGDEVGDYLVSHPQVDFVAFTGSKDVGLRIVKFAGETVARQRNVKKVIAEMGGKNAIIVDDTADLDAAIKGVVESALGFQGQKCSACSRAIVVGEMYDEFCTRLKQAMESVSIGPPEDPENLMGPVVSEAARKKILDYIQQAEQYGKPLLVRHVDGEGYYVGPAVFVDVDPSSPIAQEEIFGPVLAVLRADDIDMALDIANSTRYALTGGIFSRSPANIRKAEREFRVGNLYINRKITGALVGRQPFGGFGMSGVGSKAGGPDYLLQFLHAKSISENTLRRGFAPKATSEVHST